MTVSTKSKARRVARKTSTKVTAKVTMSEQRVAARKRHMESRSRAVQEGGVKATAPRVVLYELKNRATGEVRTLIDARGDGSVADKPWLVTNGTSTVGFATRKELGQNYSKPDLFGKSKAPAKRVAKK
jgi:hypothetical protein